MNCKHIQDELILHIGRPELPDDIRAHLESCSDCRALWSELTSAARGLGSDSDFYLDEADLEASVSRVDDRIDRLELGKVTDVRRAWMSYVPAMAAVVLLVGMSLIIYTAGWLNGNGGQTALGEQDSLFVTVANGDVDDFSESEYEYILHQVSIDSRAAATGVLSGDITEEELEYLDQNFDVGEIL